MIKPFIDRVVVPMLPLLVLVACVPAQVPLAGEPVADPERFAQSLQQATTPGVPRQANFEWILDEAGSRVRGRGVVRFVAPERQRLDLFGPRGETYLAAALVGEEFRLPPAAAQGFELPSPALLWSALGVIRPPAGAPLSSASMVDDTVAVLRYQLAGDEQLEFRAAHQAGQTRLLQVERRSRRGALETLRLEYGADGSLARTRYRDWSAYRDLVFETESIRDVTSFPENIWRPDAASR
ncbi:hypothetical protein BH23GEM6_BH23GEM6_25390 [soil metagenome]